MKPMKVNRYKLNEVLTENRAQHLWEYGQTARGYLEFYLARLDELRRTVKRCLETEEMSLVATLPNLSTRERELRPPACHGEDYARVLEMLQWSSADTIELQEREFERYVRDNWEWKPAFEKLRNLYMGVKNDAATACLSNGDIPNGALTHRAS